MNSMQSYKMIFFDCDSTLIKVESLDLLGDYLGVGSEVSSLTEKAMNGDVSMRDVFKAKVDLMSPALSDIKKVSDDCLNLIVDGAREVIEILHHLDKEVFIMSSNFHHLVDPIADALGIPAIRVIANDIYFDKEGNYAGMNEASPLCTNLGKRELLEKLIHPEKKIVFVGDGSTDLSVKGLADLFVGFGGVVERRIVKEDADIFIGDPHLYSLLANILTEEEISLLNDQHKSMLENKINYLTNNTKTTDT